MIFADVATALSSIKTASDLIALMYKAKIDNAIIEKALELNTQIITLQDVVFSLQAQNHTMLDENNDLKNQIVQMEQWKTEAARYELKEIAPGVLVYAIKPEVRTSEPVHWLCPNCYEQRRKSILQLKARRLNLTIYSCPHCKTDFPDHANPLPVLKTPPTSVVVG